MARRRLPWDMTAEAVRAMFSRIVPRYDLMNTVMTGGRDRAWRRRVARRAPTPSGGRVLDLGTGTGELALSFLREGAGTVVGLDFSGPMLARASRKLGGRASLVLGDALRLPFRDGAFDVVASAFLLRNLVDLEAAFREMARVVRPGGWVLCLEVSLPPPGPVRPLFRAYFYHLVPLLGSLLTGQRDAYRYLPLSLDTFPSPEGIVETMRRAGLEAVSWERWGLGSITLHRGRRA